MTDPSYKGQGQAIHVYDDGAQVEITSVGPAIDAPTYRGSKALIVMATSPQGMNVDSIFGPMEFHNPQLHGRSQAIHVFGARGVRIPIPIDSCDCPGTEGGGPGTVSGTETFSRFLNPWVEHDSEFTFDAATRRWSDPTGGLASSMRIDGIAAVASMASDDSSQYAQSSIPVIAESIELPVEALVRWYADVPTQTGNDFSAAVGITFMGQAFGMAVKRVDFGSPIATFDNGDVEGPVLTFLQVGHTISAGGRAYSNTGSTEPRGTGEFVYYPDHAANATAILTRLRVEAQAGPLGAHVMASIWFADEDEPADWTYEDSFAVSPDTSLVMQLHPHANHATGPEFGVTRTISVDSIDFAFGSTAASSGGEGSSTCDGLVAIDSFEGRDVGYPDDGWGTASSGFGWTYSESGLHPEYYDAGVYESGLDSGWPINPQHVGGLLTEGHGIAGGNSVRSVVGSVGPWQEDEWILRVLFAWEVEAHAGPVIAVIDDSGSVGVQLGGSELLTETAASYPFAFTHDEPYYVQIHYKRDVVEEAKIWIASETEPVGYQISGVPSMTPSASTYLYFGGPPHAVGISQEAFEVAEIAMAVCHLDGGCTECAGTLPFLPNFLPAFRRQIGDPTTLLDSYICTLESGAMALDWQTRGGISLWGGELIPYCGRSEVDIQTIPGTNLGNVQTAWQHFGQHFDNRSGQSWNDLLQCLGEGRAVVVQGDYGLIDTATSCQPGFVDNHAMVLLPFIIGTKILTGDPLCTTWHGRESANLQAYMEALGVATFGVTSPQKILFGVSYPWATT